jgi:hypothetical protein
VNFFKSAAQINIDSSYISTVGVDAGADYEQLKNLYPPLAVANIKL